MKILDCKQGSTEWEQARLGVVTASEADALLTPLFKIRTGEGVETYLYRKLAEKILHWSPEAGSTFAMDQGSLIESLALPWFGFTYDCEPRRVGFCVSDCGRYGCSPDAILGDDNGLEVKAPQPPTHLKYLLAGELPPEYRVQVHFSMFVTGRPRWTFLSYSRQFDPLVIPVERDEAIQAMIRQALDQFFIKFDAAYAKIKAIKDAENAQKQAAYQPDESK